jgi:hypothetical protein
MRRTSSGVGEGETINISKYKRYKGGEEGEYEE